MELMRDKIKRDTYMCSKICNMIRRGDLRDDHPQQRKSGQWDRETRDNLIVTVVKNEDFDPIKICEQLTDGGVVLWLIDGLQRLTTMENYKSGKFALGKNIDPYFIKYQEAVKDKDGNTTYKNVEFDLRGKAYKDLPEKLKEDFDNCPVEVVKHLDCTDEEVGRHIVRYNSGRRMVPAQKLSAYMYNTAKYVKSASGHAFFNDCANYSESADRNGTVDKVVSETIMGLNFFEVWTKDAKKIGQHLNLNATKAMFDKFENYLDRLLEVITPETGKLFTQKNAVVWFMLFDRFTKRKLNDDKFQLFLENFDELKKVKIEVNHNYELVKGSGETTNVLSFAEIDGCKSTKDKGIIEDKLLILETLMNSYLGINKEEASESIKNTVEPTEVDILKFVKENVDLKVMEDDIELHKDNLEAWTVGISDNSKMKEEGNKPSMISIAAYAFVNEELFDDETMIEWFVDYENRHRDYLLNQKENYLLMKNDLNKYIKKEMVA